MCIQMGLRHILHRPITAQSGCIGATLEGSRAAKSEQRQVTFYMRACTPGGEMLSDRLIGLHPPEGRRRLVSLPLGGRWEGLKRGDDPAQPFGRVLSRRQKAAAEFFFPSF